MKSFEVWLKSLVAAVVTGAANAGMASLGITVGNLAGMKIPALDWKQVLTVMASGGFIGMLAYLAKSPVPPSDDGGTTGTKTTAVVLAVVGAAWLWSGCAALAPGADPIEVRAEQTVSVAASTFDTFLKLEYDEIGLVRSNAPAVHQFAEWLRTPTVVGTNIWPRDIALVQSANAVRQAYKANRSAANQSSLAAALAAVEAALAQAQAQLAALGTLVPGTNATPVAKTIFSPLVLPAVIVHTNNL